MTDPEELTVEFTDVTGTRRRIRYRPEPGTDQYLRTTLELQDNWRITGEEVVQDLAIETESQSIFWLGSGEGMGSERSHATEVLESDADEDPSVDPEGEDGRDDNQTRFDRDQEPLTDGRGSASTASGPTDAVQPSVELNDFTVTDEPDSEVFVSANQDNPRVYHTVRECQQSPESIETVTETEATDGGLRECASCVDIRYDFLE